MIPWLRIAVVGVILLAISAGVWKVIHSAEKRGYAQAVAEYTAKALAEEQAARLKEQGWATKSQEATNAASKREAALKRDLAGAADERVGLHNQLAAADAAIATASGDAVRKYATTANAVFEECTRELFETAAAADGHASDSLKLQEAWPR